MDAHPADGVPARAGISRRTRYWAELAAAGAITAALCGAFEFGSALLLRGVNPAAERAVAVRRAGGDYVELTKVTLATNAVPLIWDTQLLWRNEPGARRTQPVNPQILGHDDAWTLLIDAEGFRSSGKRDSGRSSNVYRILCIGDSITFGFNVDQDAPYPRQLEVELGRRYPGRVFEVINAGVPGWSWLQGERFLRFDGLALHPSLVVMGHGTNDQFFPTNVTDREKLGSSSPWARAGRWMQWQLMRTNTYRALAHFLPKRDPATAPSLGCDAQLKYSQECRRASVFDIAQAIHNIHHRTAEAGTDLLVVNVDFQETPAVKGIRAGVEADSVPYLDFVARFTALQTADAEHRAEQLGLQPGHLTAPPADPLPAVSRVVLRVLAPERGAHYGVVGYALARGSSFQFDVPLFDDGSHGDEVAGDGVFSTTVEMPGGDVHRFEYRFTKNGTAEFVPLPPLPSTQGVRMLELTGDEVAPLAVFGEMRLMVEHTHPNAEGHRLIATTLADEIARLPSFARFVKAEH